MNQKIINNAISSYFGLGLLLLLPSKKTNINHPFVKLHAKTALFIHLLAIINYIVFITYSFLSNFSFFGFSLNHILASLLFLGLFGWLLYGAFRASKGEDFKLKDMAKMTKTNHLFGFQEGNTLNEEGITSIIIALIPFLGFLLRGKFYDEKSSIIENNLKINFISTLIILIFFQFGYENIALLLLLFYIIAGGFYAVLLITQKSIITFNIQKLPHLEEFYLLAFSFFQYLKNFFSKKDFIGFHEIFLKKQTQFQEIIQKKQQEIDTLKKPKLPEILSYIPYINIICLYDISSKNKYHIINGISISIVSVIFILIGWNHLQIFLLIPLFFGAGFLEKKYYSLPIFYEIYLIFSFILNKIFSGSKKALELKNTKNEISFEIEEK